MSNVLSIRHLTKKYGSKPVLNDINFDVEDGEFFVVYGPSGVGKTTLLNLIVGLTEADSGEIWLDNRRIDQLEPDERRVSMTFQSYALYPQWTAFDNIASPLRSKKAHLSKEQVNERVQQVAKTLTIDHVLDHRPGELSGGQKQRVGLARSIVRPGRVLLLDSPLAHVDTKVRYEMRGRLKDISRTLGCAVIYVTHDYLEALGLGDRIAILKDGAILEIVKPHELYQQPVNTWVAQSVGQPEINMFSAQIIGTDVLLDQQQTVPLPDTVRSRLLSKASPETAYKLGIRPEQFEIRQDGELHGHVQLSQWLGTRTIITVIVQGLPNLVIAAWGRVELEPGTEVRVGIQWENVLWFDVESQRNIFVTEEASHDASTALTSK